MTKYRLWMGILLCMALLMSVPLTAQEDDNNAVSGISDIVTMVVDAGYDGHYRENHWLPLRITVRNDGEAITGKLTVRPETSGRVVSNTYSTPIDLPAGSEKTAFLYIQARRFPPLVTVELLDEANVRITQTDVSIIASNPYDKIHLILAGALTDTLNLQTIASGGRNASQARWTIEQLPALPEALTAIDLIMITNIDSEALTIGQIEALREYVLRGGHLIITGGPNWQSNTATLSDLLPMTPTSSESIDNLQPLAGFAGDQQTQLAERTVIATGDLVDDAQVLVADSQGNPLIIRSQVGGGIIDFFVADPALEPLRSWRNLPDVWFNLLATRPMMPGWMRGIVDYNEAATAVAVLPGIELLPPVESMLAYIAFYILLIGPLNYIILARFNRRGWAWVTIPLIILIFSTLSWTVGFNLRGNEVIMSRLTVVQSWDNQDDAILTELIGILSPRRATYTLNNASEDDQTRPIRVMPALEQTGILAQNITQSTSEIIQTTDFRVQDITVDGGIFANYSLQGKTPAPAITGSLTLVTHDNQTQSLQGAIRNDSETITLENAVILARGVAYRLNAPFEPGDLITLDRDDLTLASQQEFPAASPFEYSYELPNDLLLSARDYIRAQANLRTTNEILGITPTVTRRRTIDDSPEAQTNARREALLKAMLRDQFSSPARGNHAYLVGWTEQGERDIDLDGTTWQDVATTLYLIELDVAVDTENAPDSVTITSDQFTWTGLIRESIEGAGPDDMILTLGALGEFRFVPQPDSILREVDSMVINIDRTSSYGRDVELSLYNWETGEWRLYGSGTVMAYTIDDPAPYLGPNNMVDVRVTFNGELGSVRMRSLNVEQTGRF